MEEDAQNSSPDMGESVLTPLEVLAVAIHEMYTAFVFAGFSEQQALVLVSDNMANGILHLQENLEDDEEDTI